jgi:hypothetical protein
MTLLGRVLAARGQYLCLLIPGILSWRRQHRLFLGKSAACCSSVRFTTGRAFAGLLAASSIMNASAAHGLHVVSIDKKHIETEDLPIVSNEFNIPSSVGGPGPSGLGTPEGKTKIVLNPSVPLPSTVQSPSRLHAEHSPSSEITAEANSGNRCAIDMFASTGTATCSPPVESIPAGLGTAGACTSEGHLPIGHQIARVSSIPYKANFVCSKDQLPKPSCVGQISNGDGSDHIASSGAMPPGSLEAQGALSAKYTTRIQSGNPHPAVANNLQVPRDPHLDGLLTAEDRDLGDTVLASTHAEALQLAKEHLKRLTSDEYAYLERRAARCATLKARQGKDHGECGSESIFATLLRRRSCFTEVPVVEVDNSFVVVPAECGKQCPRSIMITSVPEDMHRTLAMQSWADAKAYLTMLNEHVDFMHVQASAAPAQRMRSLEIQEGESSESDAGVSPVRVFAFVLSHLFMAQAASILTLR